MRKFLSIIGRVIAAIFAFFFIITTPLAILFTILNGQMFNSNLYKNALLEQNIYARLPELVGEGITGSLISNPCTQNQLVCAIDGASPELQACLTAALGPAAYQSIGSGARAPTSKELQLSQPCLDRYGSGQATNPQAGTTRGGMPSFMQNFTSSDWQSLLTILLPPATLKSMTESVLDQVFAYLNGEDNSVSIPLDALKQSLLSPSGADLFLQVLNSQEPCNEQGLIPLIFGTSNGGMIICKPPEYILPIVTALLPKILNASVPLIPDRAYIIKPPVPGAPSPGSGPFGVDPISTLRTIRLVMRLSLLIPLILLFLVTLCAVRSLKSWLQWWGIPFFTAGIISLGLGVLIVPAFNTSWTWFVAHRIPAFIPAVLPEVGLELFRSILHTLSRWIVVPSVVLCVLGMGAWIGSTYVKGKDNPDPTDTMPPATP